MTTKKKTGASHPLSLDKVVRNARNKIDGRRLLASLDPASTKLVFFDPQYRGLLDKQKYGNASRQSARVKLPQMSDDVIAEFVTAILRVMKPSAHLVLWCDKFTVASGRHLLWWDRHLDDLNLVDKVVWNKIAPGMGRRSRCYYEEALIFQKSPTRAKGIWLDRGIMDCWPENSDRSLHTHAKPTQFIYRLIRCVTKTGDLVVDPCAGGYGVLEACRSSGREFVGGDLI